MFFFFSLLIDFSTIFREVFPIEKKKFIGNQKELLNIDF